MKARTLVAEILLTALLIASMPQMLIVHANPFFSKPQLKINSPEPYSERTYLESTVELEINASSTRSNFKFVEISYSLDFTPKQRLNITHSNSNYEWLAKTTLQGLSSGNHVLRAYSVDNSGHEYSTTTIFLVNVSFTDPALIVSPLNMTYGINQVQLNYTITQLPLLNPDNAVIQYVLDNSSLTRLYRNTTLSELSEGQHKLTLMVNTNGTPLPYSIQSTYFSINTTKQEQPKDHNFMTTIFIAVSVVAIGSVVAVAISRRRKAQRIGFEIFEN